MGNEDDVLMAVENYATIDKAVKTATIWCWVDACYKLSAILWDVSINVKL
jgi:hypothetical protein